MLPKSKEGVMPESEVLDPQMDKREAARLLEKALKHFQQAKRASIQVMADLRRLQDGGVHLLHGERNFFRWVEATFDGISAGSAKQLARAGAVVLELERTERIDLAKPQGVGTTALRALSVIANDEGNERMIEVYDTARRLAAADRDLTEAHVEAATRLLDPPAEPEPEREPEPAVIEDDGYEEDDDELRLKIGETQDLLWELGDHDGDTFDDLYRQVEEALRDIQAIKRKRELPGHGPGCKPIPGSASPRFPGEPQYVCVASCPRRRALNEEMDKGTAKEPTEEPPKGTVGSAE